MTQDHQITIHLGRSCWLATFSGPKAKAIGEAFGTCTLPTAFTVETPLATVIATIQAKNPDYIVRHWNS